MKNKNYKWLGKRTQPINADFPNQSRNCLNGYRPWGEGRKKFNQKKWMCRWQDRNAMSRGTRAARERTAHCASWSCRDGPHWSWLFPIPMFPILDLKWRLFICEFMLDWTFLLGSGNFSIFWYFFPFSSPYSTLATLRRVLDRAINAGETRDFQKQVRGWKSSLSPHKTGGKALVSILPRTYYTTLEKLFIFLLSLFSNVSKLSLFPGVKHGNLHRYYHHQP